MRVLKLWQGDPLSNPHSLLPCPSFSPLLWESHSINPSLVWNLCCYPGSAEPPAWVWRVTARQSLQPHPSAPAPSSLLHWAQPSWELDWGLCLDWKTAFSFLGTWQQAQSWRLEGGGSWQGAVNAYTGLSSAPSPEICGQSPECCCVFLSHWLQEPLTCANSACSLLSPECLFSAADVSCVDYLIPGGPFSDNWWYFSEYNQ